MEKACDPTAVGPPSAAVTHSDGSYKTSSVSLITVQEFWSAPLHSVASGLDFGPLQQLRSFLFQLFWWRCAAEFGSFLLLCCHEL